MEKDIILSPFLSLFQLNLSCHILHAEQLFFVIHCLPDNTAHIFQSQVFEYLIGECIHLLQVCHFPGAGKRHEFPVQFCLLFFEQQAAAPSVLTR